MPAAAGGRSVRVTSTLYPIALKIFFKFIDPALCGAVSHLWKFSRLAFEVAIIVLPSLGLSWAVSSPCRSEPPRASSRFNVFSSIFNTRDSVCFSSLLLSRPPQCESRVLELLYLWASYLDLAGRGLDGRALSRLLPIGLLSYLLSCLL